MSNKIDTTSTVTLILNGEQTKTSLRDITQAVNAARAALSRMNEADNPELYRQRIAELGDLTEAQRQHRAAVNGVTEEQKGFFSDFKKGFSEITEMAGSITAGTLIYKGVSSIIGGIKDLFNGSEQAYDEAQRTQTQLQAALKSTGGVVGETQKQLENYQQVLMDQTGVDDDVIAKGEEMLLTFTNIRGRIYEQALPAIIDMTAAMNGGKVSMEGIQTTSIQVGKALNDPITGFTKLQKVGVTFNNQQKEQIKTMVRNNDVMGAQSIILKELNKEFGGTAVAIANTDVGKLQKFATTWDNLKEKIGQNIVAGKSYLADFFMPFIEALVKGGTSAQNLSDAFYKQKDAVQSLEKNTQPLIERYEQLKSKGELNKIEQVEMNKIINTLAETIPTAVTQWDKYGRALGINTDKARDFIAMQQAMLKIKNKDAIDESKATVESMEARASRISGILSYGKTNILSRISESSSTGVQQRDLTPEEIINYSNQLKDIKAQVDDLKLGIKGLMGENIEIPTAKVIPPGGGPTAAEQAAEQRAREAAAKKADAYAKKLEDIRSEYLSLTEAAKKGTVDDLDAQLALIDDKYNKVVAKLAKLAKDPKVAKEFGADIDTLNKKGGLRDQEKTNLKNARFTKDNSANASDQFNGLNQDTENFFTEASTALQDQETEATRLATSEEERLKVKQEYQDKELQLQLMHLEAMKRNQEMYGGNTTAIDKKISDARKVIVQNDVKNKEQSVERQEQLDQKRYEFAKIITNGLSSLVEITMGNSQVGIAMQKAITVAQIAIDTASAISSAVAAMAKGSLTPIDYALKVAGMIAAILVGISKAKAALSAGDDVKPGAVKKAAKGALIPSGPSHAQGGIDLVNNNTGESIAEMEGGEPIMILSKDTYANNRMLVNELLFNSQYRNGAPVSVNSTYATRPAGSLMQYGGLMPTMAASKTTVTSQAPAGPQQDMADYNRGLSELAQKIDTFSKKPWSFPMRQFMQEMDNINRINNNSNG